MTHKRILLIAGLGLLVVLALALMPGINRGSQVAAGAVFQTPRGHGPVGRGYSASR